MKDYIQQYIGQIEKNFLQKLTFLESFRRKSTIIIHCFEIKTEKTMDLLAAAQCHSHYKHHPTVNYLFSILPQKDIIFISTRCTEWRMD